MVATPIGNLKDVTLRALETLQSVDFILCEDTRVTKKLLNHYQINKPTISYHQHSPDSKTKEIIKLLEDGKNLALVTDAGTPGISDPGNLLIQNLTKNLETIEIIPIPGSCAAIAALSVSGFPTDRFYFAGFPPHKNKRKKFFKELAAREETIVFYESTHRILKTLLELQMFAPQRKIMVARELTKQFETIYRGIAEEILEKIKKGPIKGEFVIVMVPI